MHEVREKASLDTLGSHTRVFLLTGLPAPSHSIPLQGQQQTQPRLASVGSLNGPGQRCCEKEATAQGHSAHRPDCEPSPAPS